MADGDIATAGEAASLAGVKPKPSCATCPFWDALEPSDWQRDKGLSYGLCRVRPPGLDSQGVTVWVQTQGTDWCGEHPAFTTTISGQPVDLELVTFSIGQEGRLPCQHTRTHLSAAQFGTRICSDCGVIV